MTELSIAPALARDKLVHKLRGRIGTLVPEWRMLAEGILGAEEPIDLLGVEAGGRIVVVLVGEAGQDLELIARGLAQHAWVEARLGDWLQLAPGLEIRPEAGVRVQLLCPAFRPLALAAARALGNGFELSVYRCIHDGARVELLVEPLGAPSLAQTIGPRSVLSHAPGAAPPPAFRTGLSDTDLGISEGERREFEA